SILSLSAGNKLSSNTALLFSPLVSLPRRQCPELDLYCLEQTLHRSNSLLRATSVHALKWGPIKIDPEPVHAFPPFNTLEEDAGASAAATQAAAVPGEMCAVAESCVIGLESGAVVAIAMASFLIGCLLTAVLWFIHYHT
ncbi:PREDICTED: uncharacterized protein LOC106820251, partial [Priapulus caudatus]|uniref:Uncharacterized protein LOC106820251 n=1 Tax=Priapulus caudatus TaxID=37621 RepID=A0ABM1F750_PRICU